MGRRKVATSRTVGRRGWFGTYTSTTSVYVHEPQRRGVVRGGASRYWQMRRWAARQAGIYPWEPLRFSVFLAVGALASKSWVALPAFAVAAGLWWWRRRPAPAAAPVRPAIAPGSEWCDFCADWTVHPTEQHRLAAA